MDSRQGPRRDEEPAGRERREHTREALEVEVGIGTANRFWNGLAENISEGGLFVATEAPFEVGDQLSVTLKLQGRPGNQPLRCEVRWVRDHPDEELPVGMGLRFVDLSESQVSSIDQYIETREIDVLFWDEDFI